MLQTIVIIAAAALAGMINSIAGGGTLLSFPALLWIGRDPVVANATNTIALWPASLAGVMGFRDDLRRVRSWLFWLTVPSLCGGILGAVLLLHTSSKVFAHLVPFLILGATLLLASQEVITRRLRTMSTTQSSGRSWIAAAFAFQFLVGIYGGYFGAGIGILMLAALGLMGLTDMHEMNGLKNLLAICINGVAAIYFASSHAVNWHDAAIMAAASIAGGFFGAGLAKRLGRNFVRAFVIAIGLFMTAAMFFRQ